jgi:hypothetical protein
VAVVHRFDCNTKYIEVEERKADIQTNRQTDGRTDIQAGRQAESEREKDRKIEFAKFETIGNILK